MKLLAALSFAIVTLIAPIHAQAQAGCVRFSQNPNPEAELRYLLAHPGVRVCPSAHRDLAGQADALRRGTIDRAYANQRLRCSMSGRVC
jgi:hypothetical protein